MMTIPAYQHDSNIWPLLLQSQNCLPPLTTQTNSSKEATPHAPTPPSANGSCTTSINNHHQHQQPHSIILSQHCYNKPQHCLLPLPNSNFPSTYYYSNSQELQLQHTTSHHSHKIAAINLPAVLPSLQFFPCIVCCIVIIIVVI
jgi:hypothetical protein